MLLIRMDAVAFLGPQSEIPYALNGCSGIFLETAHPAKFPETVEAGIGKKFDSS